MQVYVPSRPSRSPVRVFAASIALSAALGACGGGDGGDSAPAAGSLPLDASPASPTDDPASGSPTGAASGAPGAVSPDPSLDVPTVPFGLTRRPPLAAFALPVEGGTGGDGGYLAVPAYPALGGFAEALHAAPVPGEDRMVVVEQAGRVKVFDDDPAVTSAELLLDIADRVEFSSEQGLLGLAFDPDFEENRLVYLHYTRVGDGRSTVSRFLWDPGTDVLDPASERRLLEVDQPYSNHNAGMLEFGPDDGYLYVALGDGGDGGDPLKHGQDLGTLLGAILRIDVHPDDPDVAYEIPPDNPFVGVAGARPEIYAYGLRNPYRFSFDRQTGDLWAGDVGQGELEEIDLIVAGGNYGWSAFEGTSERSDRVDRFAEFPDSLFTPPVHEYGHDLGIAIIGGYVYRGSRVPSLFGRYLFADFGSGTVWALDRGEDGATTREALVTVEGPTGFAETADGDVLVISRYGGLLRLEPSGGEATAPPPTLSGTGLFTDLASLTPAEGLIEYVPSHPFWSDGTNKRRWLGVPDDARIGFTADDWTFPLGTVSVKHFEIELVEGDPTSTRRLETRVLLHAESGWEGYTYRWNEAQSDATLQNDRVTERLSRTLASGGTREQRYEYPSRADCLVCHTRAAGFLLGPKTAQLNAPFDYADGRANQLATFDHVGLLEPAAGDVSAYTRFPAADDASSPVDARARAYLDVNCSSCHMPGGSAPTTMDLRAGIPLEAMDVVDVTPSAGGLGLANARIVAPGDRASSVLWERMRILGEGRMPLLSTHVVDEDGVALIGEWIDGLR